jgi:methylamine dehydrogenase heavy chain
MNLGERAPPRRVRPPTKTIMVIYMKHKSILLAVPLVFSMSSGNLTAENVEFAGDLKNVVIEDQKQGEHRFWINDFAGGLYSRAVLFNGDSGEMLGSVETGWEGVELEIPRSGDVIYSNGLYLSRGYHGERTDALEFYNRSTLHLEKEIILPPKSGRGLPNTNHSSFSDDERFLFLTFFTPASSVGVVDLKSQKYLGEIETAGCAYVLGAGPRRFFSICGDGSVLSIVIDNAGRELTRKRYPGLFDAVADPLHGTAVRGGNVWYFVTQLGVVHSIDVGGAELEHKVLWKAGEKSGDSTAWVPAEMFQHLAFHKTEQRLYVLMGNQDLTPKGGGVDYHRHPGTEIWVFDVTTGKRLQRIKMPTPMYAIAVSQDDSPLLYASSLWNPKVQVFNALSGELLREIESSAYAMNTILQPVEPR